MHNCWFGKCDREMFPSGAVLPAFVRHFCPPGSRSWFRIRIRIHWPDWIRIQYGSASGSDWIRIHNTVQNTGNKTSYAVVGWEMWMWNVVSQWSCPPSWARTKGWRLCSRGSGSTSPSTRSGWTRTSSQARLDLERKMYYFQTFLFFIFDHRGCFTSR